VKRQISQKDRWWQLPPANKDFGINHPYESGQDYLHLEIEHEIATGDLA